MTEIRLNLGADRAPSEADLWRQLGAELFDLVDDPDRLELVVTEHFSDEVQHQEVRTPHEYGPQVGFYQATKADGTVAAAKTIALGDRRAIVVAADSVLDLGVPLCRWMLTHEAQHVRLHQLDIEAWAVHRRHPVALPPKLPLGFHLLRTRCH